VTINYPTTKIVKDAHKVCPDCMCVQSVDGITYSMGHIADGRGLRILIYILIVFTVFGIGIIMWPLLWYTVARNRKKLRDGIQRIDVIIKTEKCCMKNTNGKGPTSFTSHLVVSPLLTCCGCFPVDEPNCLCCDCCDAW